MSPELWAWLPSWLEAPVLGRLLLALALGTVMGLERELRGKPAGLRTVILITVGAALFTEGSLLAAAEILNEQTQADPARIAAQIVSGVGFLGAGTIIVHRGGVEGLTTAATLWVAAAIGLSVGLGAYVVAVGATLLVLVTLVALGWVEARYLPEVMSVTLHVTLERRAPEGEAVEGETPPGGDLEGGGWVRETLLSGGFHLMPLEYRRDEEVVEVAYRVRGPREAGREIFDRLSADPRVRGIRIER